MTRWTASAVVRAIQEGRRDPAVRSAARRTHGTWVDACAAAGVEPPDAAITSDVDDSELRTCERCGVEYPRRRDESGHLERSDRWLTRRYCSRTCANEAQRA